MTVRFTFGAAFQDEMLGMMLIDHNFAAKVIQYIPEENLYSIGHKFIFVTIAKKLKDDGKLPSLLEVDDSIKFEDRAKRRMLRNFVKRISELPVTDTTFLKDRLGEYAKKTIFTSAFQDAQTLWNAGKSDTAYEFTMEAMNELHNVSFYDDLNVTIDQFEELRQRYQHELNTTMKRIPTGIPPIDEILRGGLSKSELGIILGEAKKGKSIGLVHMGSACLMTRTGRVLHFVLEGRTEQTSMRYQSRLTGIEYNNIKMDTLTDVERDKLANIKNKYFQNLELVPFNSRWGYTVQDIESKILEMERNGKKPDMVIVDYGDILTVPESDRRQEFRFQQTQIFRGLKSIAMVHLVALWTASQATKPKDDGEEYLLRARNIAEAYEKVRVTDFLMTLNQTAKEKELGLLRIHVDTYRDNETDITISAVVDFSRMIFYSRKYGHLTKNEYPSWGRRTSRKRR